MLSRTKKAKSNKGKVSSKLPIVRRPAKAAITAEAAKGAEPVAEPAVEQVTVTEDAQPAAAVAAPADGKRSCLDAAAEVLRASGQPMRCRELVDAMRAKGLWTSTAPTPHQTLASALLREITKKGTASRFRKADRGQFALNP